MSSNFKFDNSGFDKFKKEFNKKKKDTKGQVSLDKLLNDNFIKKYTKYNNLDDFVDASEIDFTDPEEAIESKEWDNYVQENTSFSGWEGMIFKAGQLYMKDKLRLD